MSHQTIKADAARAYILPLQRVVQYSVAEVDLDIGKLSDAELASRIATVRARFEDTFQNYNGPA